MSVAFYRTVEKKCATCCWWHGQRGIEIRGREPFYVKVESVPAPCIAMNGQMRTPMNVCYRWSKWEKL